MWFTLFRHLQLLFISMQECPGEWLGMIHLRRAPILPFLFTPVSMAEVLVRFLWLFFFPRAIFSLWTTSTSTTALLFQILPSLQNIWNILCISSLKNPYSSQELSRSFPLDELCFVWIFQFFSSGNIWPIRIRKSHLFAIGFSYHALVCW